MSSYHTVPVSKDALVIFNAELTFEVRASLLN